MAAEKGNQNWKVRIKHGSEKKFEEPEDMAIEINGYFEWSEKNPLQEHVKIRGKQGVENHYITKPRPFTIQALCNYLDITIKTLENYSTIAKRAKEKLDNEIGLTKEREEYLKKEVKLGEGFLQVITRTREAIYSQKYEGAAVGFFKENLIVRDLNLANREINEVVVEQPLFPDAHKPKK